MMSDVGLGHHREVANPIWKRPAVAGGAVTLCVIAGVAVWQLKGTRPQSPGKTPDREVLAASQPAVTPAQSAPKAIAASELVTSPIAVGSAPSPPKVDTAAISRAVDDQLDAMIAAGAAEDWTRADESARSIRTSQAQLASNSDNAAPNLLTEAQDAIGRGDYSAAADSLSKITAQSPRDGRAWSALGYAWLRMHKLPDARKALGNGLRLRPTDAGAWVHLGEVLAADPGTSKASLAALRLAVHFSPDRTATLKLLKASSRNHIGPEFQAVIRAQGNRLDQIPEMTK
jgi:tetratricopeptide (TPR) repeat protein